MQPLIPARTSRSGFPPGGTLPLRIALPLLVLTAVACGLSGCSQQAGAYSANPICREARQKCQTYHRAVKLANTDRGVGMELLREDCEASQRACAEGVSRSLETSYPEDPGKRKTSYWDY